VCSSDLVTDLSTGFSDIDNQTGGLAKGDLIILAARPSMGKTSLALQIAQNVAKEQKQVAIFSLEMNNKQLVQRMIASEARINILSMRTGKLLKREYPLIALASGPLSEAMIYIDDFSMENPGSVLSKGRRLKRKEGLDLIIIDYLQLMDGNGNKEENRQQEITKITRSLKQTAKLLDIPLIVLSQLSRACELRNDKRPQLSDLRESGAIEQDADVVMFLYRPEVYEPSDENKGKVELIISKQRNGPIGTVPLTFLNYCAKFENYTVAEPPENRDWRN
jgi:replicative DNA helicase